MTVSSHVVIRDVTVVIPTLGRPTLRRCLGSIAAGSAWPAHLIVVDQGRNPDVPKWLDELRSNGLSTEHIRSSQAGAAAARNRGIERVRTDFIAATDDDCLVEENWLELLAGRVRNAPDMIFTGRVEAEGTGHALSLITSPEPAVYRRPLLDRDPLFAANMGFSRRLVTGLGLFNEDPRVRYAEDAEWSYRALRAGIPIAYAPELVVHHVEWRDAAQLRQQYRRYARSQGAFYGAHLRHGDRFIALRVLHDLLRGPWILLRAVFTGNRELLKIGHAYVTELLPGIIAGLRGS